MDGTIEAVWVGPGPVFLPATRTLLHPGDTVVIGAAEAEESGHWAPAPAAPTKAKEPQDGADEGKE